MGLQELYRRYHHPSLTPNHPPTQPLSAQPLSPRQRLLVPARREDGALVHQVLQVRAAEASGALGDVRQGDALRQLLVPNKETVDR